MTSVTIPVGVTTIDGYAFDDCDRLADVYFGGTQEQWNAITIDSNNEPLTNAAIHFSSTGPTYIAQGTCGDNLTWTLDEDGTLTVSGTGEMPSYSSGSAPWYSNCSSIEAIVIEKGVTSIGDYAFYYCSSLSSVTIPEGITSIGTYAFYECSKLTSVTISDDVTSIGDDAFTYSGLTDVYYDGSLVAFARIIGENWKLAEAKIHHCDGTDQFAGIGICGNDLMWTLDAAGKMTISGTGDMENYSGSYSGQPWRSGLNLQITSIAIMPGVTSISNYAFYGCGNLTSITIPSSVTMIGGQAFDCCDSLTDIYFAHRSKHTLTIQSFAFDARTDSNVNVTTRVYVMDLEDVHGAILTYDWPGSDHDVSYVSVDAKPAQSITISAKDSVAEAEVGVSVGYTVLAEPSGTTSDILWSIIPGTGTASVNWKGVVTGLTAGTVTVRATSGDNAEVYGEATLTILAPTGGDPTAVTVTTGGLYENEVAAGETIPMLAGFTPTNASSRNVTWEVQNGTGTAEIDQQGNLKGLTPGSVTVYATTDNGCENSCTVNVVRYAESVQIFFDGKSDTTSMGIGESKYLSFALTPENTSTTKVNYGIVKGTGAAELDWDDNYYYDGGQTRVTWITGTKAGTVTLYATAADSHAVVAKVELEITDTIQPYAVVGGNIYYNTETGWITGSDSTVTNAVIPATIDGVTIVGIAPDAFANVNNSWHNYYENTTLTSVSIPATVKEIGRRAFYNCTALSNLRFSGTSQLTTIGEGAFYECESLTSLTIPDSVTTVGGSAFSGLFGLKYLTISGEVDSQNLGFNYFTYFGDLQTITYTGSFIRSGKCTVYEDGYSEMLPGVFCSAKKLILSDSITSIGDYAFTRAISGIGDYATEVVLGGHVTSIGQYAFSYCSAITAINLPDSLTSIGQYAFQGCSRLSTINLPDSLTHLGEGCFKNCTKLNLIDLSQIPDIISDAEYLLTGKATLPDHVIKATGGKVSFEWQDQPATDDYTSVPSIAYVLDYTNGKQYLECLSSGQIKLICEDEYTGLQSSKIIEIKAGIQIRPTDLGYLTSGQSTQLSAWIMPSGTKTGAYWFLSDGDEAYATLTSAGKLTAKTVTSARQITVNAMPYSGGETVTKSIWILPKTTGLRITQNGDPLNATLEADMQHNATLNLSVTAAPAGASDNVKWSTSDKKIATVSGSGEVTLLKPGKVTITATATDGSKKSAKVTLTVYYLDTAAKLTAVSDVPALGLQPGQTATITVSGSSKLPQEKLIFSIPASQQKIATVDKDTGVVIAGNTSGTVTVTVTAALRDDPLNRKATIKIKVIAMQAQDLKLSADVKDPAVMEDDAVILDAKDVSNRLYTFTISAQAMDYTGNWAETKNVTWASGNTAIATVKANADGTATVTVKKGTSGECAITATAKDLGKVSMNLWLSVRNYQPRLENNKPTLNTALTSGVTLELLESYENTIHALRLYENGAVEPSTRFAVTQGEDTITIQTLEAVKSGTYKLRLEADCENGQTYTYALQLKVTSALPAVTLKQKAKFNLFYRDGSAEIAVSAKNAVVENVILTSDTFTGSYVDGVLTLCYSDDYIPGTKVNSKATVEVWLEGYRSAVTKSFTISTVTTAPKLKLSSATSVINVAMSEDRSVSFQILDADGKTLDSSDTEVTCNNTPVLLDFDDAVTLTLNDTKSVTATLEVQKTNWVKSVKLTHKITVQEALPTLKLRATTLKLNSVFPEQGTETTVSLSQGNLALFDVEITGKTTGADKLDVSYQDGCITAKIKDGMTVKSGTYSFTCVGKLDENVSLKPVTLKITVSTTIPKVKLASTTFKLNRNLYGQETVSTKVTVPSGYTLVGFNGIENAPFEYVSGYLTARLTDENSVGGSYTLYPVLKPNGSDEEVPLPTGLKVKVTTYAGKVSATVSAKGKLDVLNPASAITYTVKLKNCTGTVSNVDLAGQDGELFQACVDENGKVILTMLEGEEYATNRNYKVTLNMLACGQPVSSNISFKITQSSLKLALTPSSLTCYQAIGYGAATLKLTSPAAAQIKSVTLSTKTTTAFQKALGENEMKFDPDTGRITFHLAHPGLLTPGKSYTVYLDVTPKNVAKTVKTTQIKLTVKVKS